MDAKPGLSGTKFDCLIVEDKTGWASLPRLFQPLTNLLIGPIQWIQRYANRRNLRLTSKEDESSKLNNLSDEY